MRVVSRIALAGCLVLGLIVFGGISGPGRAEDNKPKTKEETKNKIVGTWKLAEASKGPSSVDTGITFTFTKDGKLILSAPIGGKKVEVKADYEILHDGTESKIRAFRQEDGKKIEETNKIHILTNDKLVTIDSDKKKTEFTKLNKK